MSGDAVEIQPVGRVQARVRPPGSKSITNRALLCAALARGNSTLDGALDSEDTRVMAAALRALGVDVSTDLPRSQVVVRGCDGKIPADRAELDLANSGTSLRFLTAAVTLGHGVYRLDGVARMRERPVADLLEALAALGADARSERQNGCPPVVVQSHGLRGGSAAVRGSVSSQYLSGLLMAAPYAREDVLLVVDGPLVSEPYVRMTQEVMRAFGVEVEEPARGELLVRSGQRYAGRRYGIEPDASAASYFWAAAAITGGKVTVEGLQRDALQGDVAFCDCLARMGCLVEQESGGITVSGGELRGIEVDMNAISDTVQTLSAVALFAQGPTTITGVAHNRFKETDRIGNLAIELRKLGAAVTELPDGLRIDPAPLHGAVIETYRDHRMAMSLALVGLRVPGVAVLDPGCTDKTYPRFFDDLRALGAAG